MKNCLHSVWMMMCLLLVCSCKEDDNNQEAEREAYRAEQDIAFQAKAKDPEYERWDAEDGSGYVFAKLIRKGNGKKAYFNSRVSTYYKGYLTDGSLFDRRLVEDGAPFKIAVSAAYSDYNSYYGTGEYRAGIYGWTVALQHMVEGDIYEVWIPQSLGYGEEDMSDIPAYSTLIFEIELVSVDVQTVAS